MRPIATLRCGYLKCVSPTGCKPSRSGAVLGPGAAASRGTLPGAMHHAPLARTQSPPITMVARSCDFAIASPFPAFHAGCGGRLAQRLRAHAEQLPPQIRGYDSRDINAPRALTRDTRPRKRLSMPGETTRRDFASVGQAPLGIPAYKSERRALMEDASLVRLARAAVRNHS